MAQIPDGPIGQAIHLALASTWSPNFLEVINESSLHSRGEAESHFRVVVVASQFAGLERVERSQKVHESLGQLISQVHALSIRALTPAEFEKFSQASLKSPKCHSSE